MKNLLIGKSFSYEIVDFTLLWQSNTYHLGGGRSIHLSYGNIYQTVHNPRLLFSGKSPLQVLSEASRSVRLNYTYSYKKLAKIV